MSTTTHRLVTTKSNRRSAFTLVEAMVALSLLSIAGAAILLATESTLVSAQEDYEQMAAAGLIRQMMEEIVNRRYQEFGVDPHSTYLGPSNWENSGQGRQRFDDIDDYNGYRSIPPEDLWGVRLGTGDDAGGQRPVELRAPAHLADNWRVRVVVKYVDPIDPARVLGASETTDFRRIRIRVQRVLPDGGRLRIKQVDRIVSYSGMDQW